MTSRGAATWLGWNSATARDGGNPSSITEPMPGSADTTVVITHPGPGPHGWRALQRVPATFAVSPSLAVHFQLAARRPIEGRDMASATARHNCGFPGARSAPVCSATRHISVLPSYRLPDLLTLLGLPVKCKLVSSLTQDEPVRGLDSYAR